MPFYLFCVVCKSVGGGRQAGSPFHFFIALQRDEGIGEKASEETQQEGKR